MSDGAGAGLVIAWAGKPGRRLGLAVDGRRYRSHRALYRGQALGMADHQVAARAQARQDAVDHLLLGGSIEIDHDVAQEDHVEFADAGQRRVQVDLAELDPGRHMRSNEEVALVASGSLETTGH